MASTLVGIIFVILMVPGVFATLIPMIPGVPYLFVLALIYGVIDRFTHLTVGNLEVLGIITVLTLLVDHFAGVVGAKYGGAHGRSLFYGFICLVIGTIVFPFFGGLIGLFLGVLFGELMRGSQEKAALRAAAASLTGSLVGRIINFILAAVFLILFMIFIF